MHDFIFENEINTFSIQEIYLMGGFRPSYCFISLGFLSKGITLPYFHLIPQVLYFSKMTYEHYTKLIVNYTFCSFHNNI